MALDVKKFLKGAKKAWKEHAKAAKESGTFEKLDDGKYITRLTGATIGESKKVEGEARLETSYVVIEGEHEGFIVRAWESLSGEKSLEYIAKWLMRYGIDPEEVDFAKFEEVLAELVDSKPKVLLSLKTKSGSEFQNVYVVKVLDDESDEDADEDDDDESDDEDEEDSDEESDSDSDEDDSDDDDESDEDDEDSSDDDGDDDSDDEDSDEEEAEVEVGMSVEYEWKGKTEKGVVEEILEDDEQIKVKTTITKNGKQKDVIRTISIEDAVLTDEEEEEEAPAPPPAKDKKSKK